MSLTADQRCEVDKLAELKVRRYMDSLFDRTLPRILGETVKAHDSNIDAHSLLFKQKWSMLKLALVAFAAGAGLLGAGWITKFLGVL